MPSIKTVAAAALGLASLGQTHVIKITAQADGVFHPDTVHPRPGDVLEFHFQAGNHSVVASDYHNACAPMNLGTGFFSGFFPTDAGESVGFNMANYLKHSMVNPYGSQTSFASTSTTPSPWHSTRPKV